MPRANLSAHVVVAAAADLADEDGFEQVTLSAVARRLGVQTASLYNHVRDRAAGARPCSSPRRTRRRPRPVRSGSPA